MAVQVEQLITDHLDLWTQAQTAKSTSGRGSNNKIELTGIKKLRELILELAVRGKLVPQDVNDEPASELLKRIAAEKEVLIKAGKLKKQKPLPPISDEEKPFELPNGWAWIVLGNCCQLENGDRSKNYPNKSTLVESGVPFVNAGHLVNGAIDTAQMTFITEDHFDVLRGGKFRDDDILFCLRGSLGKSAIVKDISRGAIASSLVIVRPGAELNPQYLLNYFDSRLCLSMIKKYDNGTAQPNLSAADLTKFLIPLPSLKEQKRIFAKVDDLMALCDQLEQQSYQQLDAHNQLVDALLATLTQSQNADELASNWKRLAAHFDTLFTTEYSINALKQSILQLAAMGKLCKQDPNDEPASELLKRIAAEKEALVKAGKIKKQKPLPPISDEEKPFELPQGWEWYRLEQLGLTSTGKTPSTSNSEFFGGEVPFIGPGQINQMGEILTSDKFLTEKGVSESTEGMPGDILTVCIGGSIGKSAITKNRITFNQQINAIRPIYVDSSYLYFAMCSEQFKKSILNSSSGSATPIINRSKWENLPIPVPPFDEQIRIVLKIGSLFEICTRCSETLYGAKQTQAVLADALVEQVVA